MWLALLFADGQLPSTVLCNAKAVSCWFREHVPDSTGNITAIWKTVFGELQKYLGTGMPLAPQFCS